MASTFLKNYERDWSVLKVVVSALWVSAVVVFFTVQYFVPRDRDIVVTSPLQLAGQGAP